jgi:hypothetical protein
MIEKIDLKMPTEFDNEDDKEQAILEIQSLIKSPAWIFLTNILNENIKIKESEILDGVYDKEKVYDESDRLKDQRMFMKQLLELPANSYLFWLMLIVEPRTRRPKN